MARADNSTWETVLDPNFINADLIGAAGSERVVTIDHVETDVECNDPSGRGKNRVKAVFFQECKPMVLNSTNTKKLNKLFGPDVKASYGKKILLRTEMVKVAGVPKNAIRIQEYNPVPCQRCGQDIKPFAGKTIAQMVEYSKKNCKGQCYCVRCMTAWKKEQEATNE